MSDARATKCLRASFGAALRQARHRKAQLFLELFASSGQVAAQWRAAGYGAMAFEINLGDHFDVTRPSTMRLIKGWLRSHCVSGMWLGTPCTTWSRARRGPVGSHWAPLRSSEHPEGLEGLSDRDQAKVRLGNRTARASAELIQLCVALKIPVALENPQTSLLWSYPPIARLMLHACASVIDADMCAFGARWRKATKVATWHCQRVLAPPRCRGHGGVCGFSARPHVILSGRDPVSGCLWTRRAQCYPKRFASWAARVVTRSADHWALLNSFRVAGKIGPGPVP